MKVLFIIDSLGSGGAEASTEVICDFLNERKVKFEILCLDKKKIGVQDRMISKGYSINFVKKGNILSEIFQIKDLIETGNFDIVHSILFRSNLRTRLARLLIKFVHLESLVNTTYSEERLKDDKTNKFALKLYFLIDKVTSRFLVDHFHSITQTVKDHYSKKMSISREKITVVYRGRKQIIQKRNYNNYNSDVPLKLINVGRHEFQKGQIYLLEVVKMLVQKGYNIKLDILGREGGETENIKIFLKENNLQSYVNLVGYTFNVYDYLLDSDIFLFPSIYEGLGGALIEAQSTGLPIICNDIEVFKEVVNREVNARMINVYDTFEFFNSIVYFIENPDKIKTYGEKSLENFKDKFELNSTNEKMYDLYFKLCSK